MPRDTSPFLLTHSSSLAERNHNIRIPGMGSDEINQVQSQSARRHPALNQHAQRLQAVREARATHQANVAAEAASSAAK